MPDQDLNDTYPYLEENRGNEGMGHVHLKNVAVHWLLQRGFSIGDIELERPVRRPGAPRGGNCYTDVYASNGATEAFVECETNFAPTVNQLSGGGKYPAREGKAVFVVTTDTIYRVDQVEREFTPSIGSAEGEPATTTILDFQPLAAPPMLPV